VEDLVRPVEVAIIPNLSDDASRTASSSIDRPSYRTELKPSACV
jgi:hypothetical protein